MNELVRLKTVSGDLVLVNLSHIVSVQAHSTEPDVSTVILSNDQYFNIPLKIGDAANRFPISYNLD